MRTIDDIIPPSRRRTDQLTSEPTLREESRPRQTQPFQFPYKTLATVALIILASLGALYYFSSAKVEITPNTVSAAVQGSFTASQGASDLPYQVITTQKIASQSVKSSGTTASNTSASGSLVIYNTQAKPQRLVANTRFATTAGLIFRIHTAVTVPAGSTAKPGSVTAKVYADKAGDSYNVGPTSFTIPGFAGTALATQVYARSSEAMSGGSSGNVPVVDAATEATARKALAAALIPDLTASLQSQVPSGYILLSGAATTTFEHLAPSPSSTTGMADIKEQGTMTAVVFPNAALAKAIAASVTGLNYQGEPLTLLPASTLQLAATSPIDAAASSFSFTLTG
ncbi:MAG: hypothetical protein ACYC1Y_02845, partial [Minisyncoccota bacterium]